MIGHRQVWQDGQTSQCRERGRGLLPRGRRLGVEGDARQHRDDPQLCQQAEFLVQLRSTVTDLCRCWSVVRWRAAYHGAEIGIVEVEPVVTVIGAEDVRESVSWRAVIRVWPGLSPVKGRPVRLEPCAAGA